VAVPLLLRAIVALPSASLPRYEKVPLTAATRTVPGFVGVVHARSWILAEEMKVSPSVC
jgi:hypothetical protein